MATCADFASDAAEEASVPASKRTMAPLACSRMYRKGDEGKYTASPHLVGVAGRMAFPPGESTCAEPPPDSTPTSACAPITAMECTEAAFSGSVASFFNRTMLSSAICCASPLPRKGPITLQESTGTDPNPPLHIYR